MFDMAEIDRQHRELVNMLNRLNDAVKNFESRNVIYRLIDEVISYTRLHFATEELLMVQSGFPEIESHKRMHAELITDTLHLRDKLDYVGEDMFSDWFNHWPFGRVLAHIQYGDKQIGDHINRYDSGLPRRAVPDQLKHA
jgi:hemerythrin-like metal-binding protein